MMAAAVSDEDKQKYFCSIAIYKTAHNKRRKSEVTRLRFPKLIKDRS
jgi:hypothetical protein